MPRALAVVPPGAKAKPKAPKPTTSVVAAAGMSERDLLAALRHKIASDIDKGVPPHALAPLARQLRDIDKEIRSIDAHDEGDEVGEAASTPDEQWTAT